MDGISKRWFDSRTVSIQVAPEASGYFDSDTLISLSGAFSNSKVVVTFDGSYLQMDVQHAAVRNMRRQLFFNLDTNSWQLNNLVFLIHPDFWGQDLAARSIFVQAKAAQALGIRHLSTFAVGNFQSANHPIKEERWSGYWVWPRLGFDAELPWDIKRLLEPKFQRCHRLSDLMNTVEGEQEWMVKGSDIYVKFDLLANSISWDLLSRYTSKRDIRV